MRLGRRKNPAPKCITCNGTGRVSEPWVPNRNVKDTPKHTGPKHAMKRKRCPSCGGTGYG